MQTDQAASDNMHTYLYFYSTKYIEINVRPNHLKTKIYNEVHLLRSNKKFISLPLNIHDWMTATD